MNNHGEEQNTKVNLGHRIIEETWNNFPHKHELVKSCMPTLGSHTFLILSLFFAISKSSKIDFLHRPD